MTDRDRERERAAYQLKLARKLYVDSIRKCLDAGFELADLGLILGLPQETAEFVVRTWLPDRLD